MEAGVATLTCGADGGRLEQFVALGKAARGAAARHLVVQAVRAPGVYVFGELLAASGVATLNGDGADESSKKHYALLTLFAYGTYLDYAGHESDYPPLDEAMLLKLRQLSIASAAAESHRRLPYAELMKLTGLSGVRALEDLVIASIYAGVLRGRLDQQGECLDVESASARDVRPGRLPAVTDSLEAFADHCDTLLDELATQMVLSEERKAAAAENRRRLAGELSDLVKSIEAAGGATGRSDTPEFVLSEVTTTDAATGGGRPPRRDMLRRGPKRGGGGGGASGSGQGTGGLRGSAAGRLGVLGKM